MSDNSHTHYYRVRYNVTGVWVEVALYDPERFGGARFGYNAEAALREDWANTGTMLATVSQGSTGALPPAEAELRVDLYAQAVQVGHWMQEQADQGETFDAIGSTLTALLHSGKPTERVDLASVLSGVTA